MSDATDGLAVHAVDLRWACADLYRSTAAMAASTRSTGLDEPRQVIGVGVFRVDTVADPAPTSGI
jgi:hypothetical protein